MLKKIRSYLGMAFFITCYSLPASAIDLAVVGTLNIANPNVDSRYMANTGTAFGFGGILGFDLGPYLGIETGALYLNNTYSTQLAGSPSGSPSLNWNRNFLTIPAMLRFHPIPFLSVSGGLYYGIALSNPGDLSTNDFGLLAVASLHFPLMPLFSLRLDAGYQLGLVNLGPTTFSQYSRNLIFLAGLQFSFF